MSARRGVPAHEVAPAHESVPADTLAPLVVGLGATLVVAGVLWSAIASLVGLALVALGLARWIDEAWAE